MALQIRPEQLQTFSNASLYDFEKRAYGHLKKYFPADIERMTDKEFSEFTQNCIERAKQYGVRSEQAVICFSHLPLLLGSDFEIDPDWEGILRMLRDERLAPNQRAKAAMLLAHEAKGART